MKREKSQAFSNVYLGKMSDKKGQETVNDVSWSFFVEKKWNFVSQAADVEEEMKTLHHKKPKEDESESLPKKFVGYIWQERSGGLHTNL